MNLNDMTENVLSMIFSFSDYEDRLNMFLLSKHIKEELKGYRNWKMVLENVHTVVLKDCRITDVSAFRCVHTLTLQSCPNVFDISALKNVHTLLLIDCPNITDVSALKTVHSLTLKNCFHVYDISSVLQDIAHLKVIFDRDGNRLIGLIKLQMNRETILDDISSIYPYHFLRLKQSRVVAIEIDFI
jgi:hypothetical protein